MFEKSNTWRRYSPAKRDVIQVHMGYVPALEIDEKEDRRRWIWALIATVAFHLFLVFGSFRWWRPQSVAFAGPAHSVYVLKQVRFRPPPAQAAQQQVVQQPKKKRKTIPIPDPTPHEPEPIEDLDLPEIDVDEMVVTIPDAPSGRGTGRGRDRGSAAGAASGSGDGPVYVGGNVSPPRKLYSPQPIYTEEARQNRVQGVVILNAIIDEQGAVSSVDVIRGLPHGLTESAVDTVKTWRFEPARDQGKPVPVYYTLTISFTVQ